MDGQTNAAETGAAKAAAAASAAAAFVQPAPEPKLLILDTTATEGPRTHEMPVGGSIQKFTFKPGVPEPIEKTVARKFLKHDAFKLVDDKGNVIPYAQTPKQPEQLQAGEKLVLTEHETVARFDELHSHALYQRCVELPGGEKFAQGAKPDRRGMVAFLMLDAKSKRNAHKAAPSEIGRDDFVPEAAGGDEAEPFDRNGRPMVQGDEAPFDQYAEHQDRDDIELT